MEPTDFPLPGSGHDDPDLMAALKAAFGDCAGDWLEEEATTFAEPLPAFASTTASLDEMIAQVDASLQPTTTAVLSRRARRRSTDADTARFVQFEAAGVRFAVPLDRVIEIDRMPSVTSLPRTPAWLVGVTNLRGEIVSVTDFARLLGITATTGTKREKIVVVHSPAKSMTTALVVDFVLGIRSVALDSIDRDSFAANDPLRNVCSGLTVSADGPVAVLDIDRLLGGPAACNGL
jgi:chemotaxis signal transduction protein